MTGPMIFARKPDARWEDFFRADGIPLDDAPTHTIVPPSAQMIPWPGRNARRHLHFGIMAKDDAEARNAIRVIVRRWHWIEPSNRFVLTSKAVADGLRGFEVIQGDRVFRPLEEWLVTVLTYGDVLVADLAALGIFATVNEDGSAVTRAASTVTSLAPRSCGRRWTMSDLANVIAGEAANALRSIATIIGCPADTDPLTDLDGLVLAVRGLAERAETVRVVTADRDALRAERDQLGADEERAAMHAYDGVIDRARDVLAERDSLRARLLTYTEATSPAGVGGTSGSMA